MTTLDVLRMTSEVAGAPYDPTLRDVYADALEEAGMTKEAAAQRATAKALREGTSEAPKSEMVKVIKRFHRYRKRKVLVRLVPLVRAVDTQWSGGSRSVCHPFFISDDGGYRWSPPCLREGTLFDTGNGRVVIETGTFVGKEATMRIHIHPDDYRHLLG